jgi:hypothetical protein
MLQAQFLPERFGGRLCPQDPVVRAGADFHFGRVTVRHENPNRFACGCWIVMTIARRPSRRNAIGTYSPAVVASARFAQQLSPLPAVRREQRCFREAQWEIALQNVDGCDVDLRRRAFGVCSVFVESSQCAATERRGYSEKRITPAGLA